MLPLPFEEGRAAVSRALPILPAAASTAALGRATTRKVTWRLLPFLFLLYVVNYLDRINVSSPHSG